MTKRRERSQVLLKTLRNDTQSDKYFFGRKNIQDGGVLKQQKYYPVISKVAKSIPD